MHSNPGRHKINRRPWLDYLDLDGLHRRKCSQDLRRHGLRQRLNKLPRRSLHDSADNLVHRPIIDRAAEIVGAASITKRQFQLNRHFEILPARCFLGQRPVMTEETQPGEGERVRIHVVICMEAMSHS